MMLRICRLVRLVSSKAELGRLHSDILCWRYELFLQCISNVSD